MKKSLLALLAALAASPSIAGDAETDASPWSVALSAGYDSRYLLYGYRLNRHLLKTDAYIAYALDNETTLWGGSWFGIIPDGTFRELDGYVGIDRALGGGLFAGAAVSAFYYIDVPFSQKDFVYELMTHLTYYHERFNLSLKDHVDTESDGHLARAILTVPVPLTERIGIEAVAEYGFAFGYYIKGDKPNHALFRLAAPIALADHLLLSPFLARSLALDAIDGFERDDTIAGVSLKWSI